MSRDGKKRCICNSPYSDFKNRPINAQEFIKLRVEITYDDSVLYLFMSK